MHSNLFVTLPVALVGPTPHRVARRVDTRWGDAGTATLSRVDRSISSRLGRPWTSPWGQAPGSHTALRMSGPILRRPKDFVDQRQRQLQSIGDVPTVVAS